MSLTVEELKKRIDIEGSAHDELLGEYLQAAFEQAQAPPPNGSGRLLLPNPELVETSPGQPDANPPVPPAYADTAEPVQLRILTRGRRKIRIPDAREITAVLADDQAVDPTDFELLEKDGHGIQLELDKDRYSRTDVPKVVKVTGRFGFVDIPANLRDAIYTLAGRSWYERNAQYADQVPVAEGAPVQAYYRQLPPRTKLVFATFSIPPAVGGLP